MKICACVAVSITLAVPQLASAGSSEPSLVRLYKTATVSGKPQTKVTVVALVNMEEIMTAPGDNCSQMTGTIKVEGIQFSQSGATLESFHFTNKEGIRYSVPTNISKLANADKGAANGLIKVGKTYFAHVQFCGSGCFASLINLYDSSATFGP